MSEALLPVRSMGDVLAAATPPSLHQETLATAWRIIEDVMAEGEPAVRRYAAQLDRLPADAPLVIHREALQDAERDIDAETRGLLWRTADRIQSFAERQRSSLEDERFEVPGGSAGHRWVPYDAAGCYAPGGRYPLPSSVLMTVIPALVARVNRVVVASPRPTPIIQAAAAIAGADALLCVGGAQAIAAMALGVGVPRCGVVVGPGNRYVTAAKSLLRDRVAIDMLAGPSELLIIADHTADAGLIAADLLAQAEHDDDARPMLVTTRAALIDQVQTELARQLETLPTAAVARRALHNGFAVLVHSLDEAVRLSDEVAPEHLELHVNDPDALSERVSNYGCVFIGASSAEVFGDYGAGPNHTLPTGGAARLSGGLSVATFLRQRTFLRIDDPGELAADAAALADLEGLPGHASSVQKRVKRG